MDLDNESASSKHSDSRPEIFVRTESNNNIEAYPKLRVRIASNDDIQLDHEFPDGSESSKASEDDSEVNDMSARSKHLEPVIEDIDGSDSSEHITLQLDDQSDSSDCITLQPNDGDDLNEDHQLIPVIKSRSSSSSSAASSVDKEFQSTNSSERITLQPNDGDNELKEDDQLISAVKSRSSSLSSSISSTDDLFEVDPKEGFNPRKYISSSSKPHDDTQPVSKDNEIGLPVDNSSTSEEIENNGNPGLVSTSQVSNSNPFLDPTLTSPVSSNANNSLDVNLSPTQIPPVQVMEQSVGYDPNRLPSSIFERSKSAMPQEWSVCSNESLFSIHIGNNSFSNDYAYMLGRSGELTKSGELMGFSPSPPMPVEVSSTESSSPLLVSKEETLKTDQTLTTEVAQETIPDAVRFPEVHSEEKKTSPTLSWKSSNNSKRSGGSADSTYSFAFPILTESAKHNSKKVEIEEQQLHPQEPSEPAATATPKSNCYSWFNCFSCRPRCLWCCCCNYRCKCSCCC